MRVHFSSVATIFVALLFVSGTVGCRSNGGDWYNPKSYTWTNPFSKDDQASHRSPDAFANTKPSLDAHPNISAPEGGYSIGSRPGEFASAPSTGTFGGNPSDPWGQHNPVASHTPPSHLSGYTVAEPSPYPPAYMTGMAGGYALGNNHHGIASMPQQHVHQQNPFPHQSQQAMEQRQNMMPYGHSDYVQTGFHQPANSNVHQQQMQHQAPFGTHGSMEHHGNFAPFGATPQNDPYVAVHQPVTVPPGFGHEHHPMPMQAPPPGFVGDGAPAGFPQQLHQPSPAGGANFW